MTDFLKLFAATILVGGLATTAHADFDDSDSDGDGRLSSEEYDEESRDRSLNTFAAYDSNEDGSIDEDEFRAGNFRRYDEDGDGGIDGDEYERDLEDSERYED